MDNDVVIKVEHISKKYCKSLKRSMLYGIKDITRNAFGLSSHSENLRKGEFWAVDDVSFEVKKGETLGIIGPNGSGKTTLLKMLNGIFWPDKGKITVKGRVGALIEVGAGFHPMLTGRENIYVNGAILGMSKREIDKKFDSIVEFADIGDFLDTPVKFYSSGMFVRLGFAVAVHCEPDILLVDEVLAVGDETFRNKCFNRMGKLAKEGTSVVLVSHDMNYINMMTTKCLLLYEGKLLERGPTLEVVNKYYELQRNQYALQQPSKFTNKYNIFLRNILICDEDGKAKTIFKTGEKIYINLKFDMEGKILNPVLHLSIYRDTYHGYNTKYDNFKIDSIDNDTQIELEITYCSLGTGIYTIGIGLWNEDFTVAYYWNWNAGILQIKSEVPMMGRFICEHKWHVRKIKSSKFG